jgi:myo-inositol-1(or 4)-monophosphatase
MGNQFLEIAVETAIEAGGVLLSEFGRPAKITYKGKADLVTEADRHSEEVIVGRLRRYYPEHAILSEEGGGQEGDAHYRWIVDPLDGTTNFAHGYPCFAVSIGFEEAGEMQVGVIYQPITKELFTSSRGEGAYLNEKRIRVSGVEHLSASLLATGLPSAKRMRDLNIHYYWNFALRSHGVRRDGSAALDLASVACGRFDGFWELGLHPWDTAAGVLLVREAGGVVTNFAGELYRLGGYEILASNGRIHTEMCQVGSNIREQITAPHDPSQKPSTPGGYEDVTKA